MTGRRPSASAALPARLAGVADPEALAWARGYVRRLAAKYRRFERQVKEQGDHEKAAMWRKFAILLEIELVGGKGCVITPFDERKPEAARLLDEAQASWHEPPF